MKNINQNSKSILLFIIFGFQLINIFAQPSATASIADSAKVFLPGLISAGYSESNGSFTPDEQTFYFTRATINWDYIAIYFSVMKDGKWSEPKQVPITGIYRDTDQSVSQDGTKLYFMSDRPLPGKLYKNYDYHLYFVNLRKGKIVSNPVLVPLPLFEGMRYGYPSFAANGNVYFTSRSGTDSDIFMSRYENGQYTSPVSLSFNDKNFTDIDPCVSSDEKFIVFASNGRPGYGGLDLWITFRNPDNTWTAPLNLGNKVNTTGSDGAPRLSRDNSKLYFSSYKEKINRDELLYQKGKVDANAILDSFKNGNRNIYEIDISDLIGRK